LSELISVAEKRAQIELDIKKLKKKMQRNSLAHRLNEALSSGFIGLFVIIPLVYLTRLTVWSIKQVKLKN